MTETPLEHILIVILSVITFLEYALPIVQKLLTVAIAAIRGDTTGIPKE